MRVGDIFIEDPVTIDSDRGVREAAERMWGSAVGCLIVLDERGKAEGIVTDRDLTTRVLAASREAADTNVATVMSSPLIQVTPADPVEEAIRLMRCNGVRRLPVCEDGRPVGIVAFDDILRVLVDSLNGLCTATRARRRLALKRARYERAHDDLDDFLHEVRDRVAAAKWKAQDAILSEIDDVRGWFRKTFESTESK